MRAARREPTSSAGCGLPSLGSVLMLLPEGPSPPSTPPVPVVGVKVLGVVEPELEPELETEPEPGVVDVDVDDPGGLLLVLPVGVLLLPPLLPPALKREQRQILF